MYTNYIYIYIHMNSFQKKNISILLLNDISMTILWKKNSNTWFVNGKTFVGSTRINKIYFSYLKPSFDLWIYIIQTFFQYIIILLITFNLDKWVHKIYPHKIFINGS
jgi:hypothetical protein